jgi:cyclase
MSGAHLEEVAPGVFAYLQPDGGWFLNNMGFFVRGDGGSVLSIDMAATAARTRA